METTPAPEPLHPAAPTGAYLSSVADRAAMVAVVVLPPLGAFVKWLDPGWMAMMSLLWSPVIVGVWGMGLWVFLRTLGERSAVRAARGSVPSGFRVLAWAWAVAMVVPGLVVLDGGDAEPWTSALLRLFGRDESTAAWYHDVQPFVLGAAIVVAVLAPVAGWVAAWRSDPVRPGRVRG